MGKEKFKQILQNELDRIDGTSTQKRFETIIEGFTNHAFPRGIIKGKEYMIFNSNDYLGLRHNSIVKKGEEDTSKIFGSGPGAVRFISGSLKVYHDLEKELAEFHGREDAMVFSSAFASNLAIIHCLIKGQSKTSLISKNTLIVSDELNHRSIIDGIRVAGMSSENKAIFKHMDTNNLKLVLEENKGKFDRVVVVTDGIFSMLGEYQNIKEFQAVCDEFDEFYPEGVITVVDDSHGVGAFGETGRGCEEHTQGKCDVLVGTLGKGFGADGGYVVGDKIVIDYFRESAATYIYSNPISPGTAGAALASIKLVKSNGLEMISKLQKNISHFKEKMLASGFKFAVNSVHPIQPILIGDAKKTKDLTMGLYNAGILVTNISYPVVPMGKDEIRAQISATHTIEDIDKFVEICARIGKELDII